MRLQALLVIVVMLCPAISLAGMDRDVRIVQMDEQGLEVEIGTPEFEVGNSTGKEHGRDAYTRILIRNWAKLAKAGAPALPIKSFLVQVPRNGRVDVRILDHVKETMPAGRIVPVPRKMIQHDGSIREVFEEDEGVYGSEGLYPRSLVEVGERMVCRGVPVARVTVHPFRWSPVAGELVISKKLRFRLVFDQPLPAGNRASSHSAFLSENAVPMQQIGDRASPFDGLLQEAVLNYRGSESRRDGRTKGLRAESSTIRSPEYSRQADTQARFLRIEVREEGMYRISYEDIVAAGFDTTDVYPWMFRLHNDGQENAVKVVSNSGWWLFTAGDWIEFHGRGVDTPFTDINVYWLSAWEGQGKQMSQIDGQVTGLGTPVDSFRETIRAEENHTIWEATPGAPETDPWFWEKMTAPAVTTYTLELPSPVVNPAAVLRAAFQGRTTASPHPNHHTTLSLEGTPIGDAFWDGTEVYVQEASVPDHLIADGSNSLDIGLPGDTGAVVDVVYTNWVEVEYTRVLQALDDQLAFSLAGSGLVEVSVTHFSEPDVRIFDVTLPLEVQEIVNCTVEPDGAGGYHATFEDGLDGTKSYLALTESRISGPLGVSGWTPPYLTAPVNGADYLIIAPQEFLPVTWPLLWLRYTQGLRVRAIGVEDIYNTFGGGLTDPQAIRDFLQYAYGNWAPPAPTYVLLIGDANTDYRDYMDTGKASRVPVHLSVTNGFGLTPDDNWYACVDGDDPLADLFIGRLPASSLMTTWEVMWKTFLYEVVPWPATPGALFAADDEGAFESLNEDLITLLPPEFEIDRVYLQLYGDVEDATADILSSLNLGRLVTTYTGHGSVTSWAGEYLFESSDVALLDNMLRLTFLVTLDCLNGYFSHFSHYCLAEEFVAAPFEGAIAAFSPSGLGYVWEHEILSEHLFSEIFVEGNRLLGPAAIGSKIEAYGQGASEDMLKTFILLGDPAVSLKAWE